MVTVVAGTTRWLSLERPRRRSGTARWPRYRAAPSIETDADGTTYEAHITKSDGSTATVKFDKNFKVTGVETGH